MRSLTLLLSVLPLIAAVSTVRAESDKSAVTAIAALLTDGYAILNDSKDLGAARIAGLREEVTVKLLTLEGWAGGNSAKQFLVVLASGSTQKAKHHLLGVIRVGTDFDRMFQTGTLSGDVVTLKGKAWVEEDAHCCPSAAIETRYKIGAHSIEEFSGK